MKEGKVYIQKTEKEIGALIEDLSGHGRVVGFDLISVRKKTDKMRIS